MDKDLTDSDLQTSQDGDNGQSLVGKLKKNVSEIISNTPLSKWFRKQNDATPTSSIRRRQDDSEDEEDLQEFQPPTKRTKLPPTKETLSLNVSEVLSPISLVNNVNKPLYRNFPEPIAGPSGYQTRKMLNSTSFVSEGNLRTTRADVHENIFKNPKASELSNKGNHSDSEESTSGYSSGRLGSKEMVSEEGSKQTSPLDNSPRKNRSLFQSSSSGRLFTTDRSLSPNRNSSLSSRMPSFNPSTFGSSSFIDRTLSTKRILNSPFYNGHTIYGGASAYGRGTRRAPQDIHKVLRPSVKIKPVNKGLEKGGLQLGKTAKRILDTLEQYSSPVSDAKKIPVVSKKHKSEGSLTKYIGANPYSLRESRSASNRELQVPSVTDLLKIKMDQQKSRLQDSTEAVRQIATKSNSVLNAAESYSMPVQRENEKHTTKIKTKISSVRQRQQHDEVVPEVKLNPISLPIKELPKFDIIVPPPVQKPLTTSTASNIIANTPVSTPMFSKSVVESKPIVVETKILKENDKTISQNGSEFKFSAPLVLAEYLKPLKALNNFTFSEPLVKKRRSIHPELDDQENKIADTNKIKKNNGENISGGVKASDSLMDKFKVKEGTWECSVCLIRNQGDKAKCVACESPKPKSNPKPTAFGPPIQLKSAETTWECPTCMIRNKEDLQKCAACEEKKPDKSSSNKIAKIPNLSDVPQVTMNKSTSSFQAPKPSDTSSTGQTNSFSFGTKFNPPSNTWECPTCMIRNKEELTNCAACETPNPAAKSQSSQPISTGTFGSDFKKKEDEWECQVCMVRNKANIEKCQCCESANPSYKPASSTTAADSPAKVSAFNFGIDKNTASSFTFGIPPDSQGHVNPPNTNASLIFGENKEVPASKTSEPPKFSFGVPSKDSKETEPKKDPPKPSEKTAEPPKAPSFSFGAEVKPSEATPSKAAPTITFGTASTEATPSKTTPTVSFDWASKSQGTSQTTTTTPSFSFGTPKKAEETGKKPDAPAFSFGATAKKSEGTNQAPTFSFGSGTKTDIAKQDDKPTSKETNINPLLKPSEKLPEKAAVAPVGFSFGLAKASTPAAVSSTTNQNSRPGESSPNKRSKPSGDDSTPQAKVPMFSFKAPSTNGDVSASPFGKPTEESKPPAAVGGFSFNFAAKTPSTTSANSASVAPTFGSIVSQADSSKQAAPMFKFASSTESPKQPNGFSFGSSSPAFGAKTSTNTAEAKPFTFGSSAALTQAPTAPFGAPPPKTSMFSFGSNTTGNKTASTFSFNAPAENKTAPQYPSFGPPKTQPSFGFNQSSAAPTFSFGSAQKTDSGFGVGSTTANPFGATANSKPESVFGAPPTQTPALNGAFNFGASTTTNQKAGFSFGAATSGSSEGAAPPSGGFNFGSNASAPAAGGFNFAGAAPAFDANTKPSFNFSGGAGVTTFSAPPSVQDGAPRKIKKAIRRVR